MVSINIVVDEIANPHRTYFIPSDLYQSMLDIAAIKDAGYPWEDAARVLVTEMRARRSEFGMVVNIKGPR